MQEKPLILTLRLDEESQAFFDAQRMKYFPPERNLLKAHLTLFHQLPDNLFTREYLIGFEFRPFEMNVSGLSHLGTGVAYLIESPDLQKLHKELSSHFQQVLIPQDKQPFRPHITIQNKVTPEASKKLTWILQRDFAPFSVSAVGMDLWQYLGGIWKHLNSI